MSPGTKVQKLPCNEDLAGPTLSMPVDLCGSLAGICAWRWVENIRLSLPKVQSYLKQTCWLLLPGGEAGGGKPGPGADPGTRSQQSKYPWAATGHQQLKHLLWCLECVSSETLLLLRNGWSGYSTWQEDRMAEGQSQEEIKVLLLSGKLTSQQRKQLSRSLRTSPLPHYKKDTEVLEQV